MLRNVKDSIKKNYYDPEFHGVNIDETFKAAEEKINEATSNGQVFGIIAKAVRSLNDSHTSFRPPPRAMRIPRMERRSWSHSIRTRRRYCGRQPRLICSPLPRTRSL